MFCACFSGSVQKLVQKPRCLVITHQHLGVLYTEIGEALGIFWSTAGCLAGALQCTAEAGKAILGGQRATRSLPNCFTRDPVFSFRD